MIITEIEGVESVGCLWKDSSLLLAYLTNAGLADAVKQATQTACSYGKFLNEDLHTD